MVKGGRPEAGFPGCPPVAAGMSCQRVSPGASVLICNMGILIDPTHITSGGIRNVIKTVPGRQVC